MAIGVKGKNVQAPHLSREGATLIVTPNGTPRFYGVRVMPFGYSQLNAIHFGPPHGSPTRYAEAWSKSDQLHARHGTRSTTAWDPLR